MKPGSPMRSLIVGLLLIAATNAVALVGVAWNRTGDPEATLVLSERELNLPYNRGVDRDNSGVSLSLQWRVVSEAQAYGYYAAYTPLEWLDKARLAALGFDVARIEDTPEGRRYMTRLEAREVLLVLELDGPAWQTMLARTREWARRELEHAALDARAGKADGTDADQVRRTLEREERNASRLFAIDAGLDAAALRERYPDRTRYAIVRGRIKPTVDTSAGGKRVTGYIEGLEVSWVNVPRRFHPALAERDASFTPGRTPRYAVTVAFGRRFEPWVLTVAALDGHPR